MSEGVPNENEELYDPGSNDPDPGRGYTFKEFYRIYLYGKNDIAPLVEYSAPYGGEFDHVPVRYVYGIPGATIRITTKESGGRDTFFLHKDANGSVRSITNVSGTEVKCYHYDPFGNIVAVTGSDTANTRRYTGRDWDDETGLTYMVARYYDPRFGRFTSPDPEPTVMSPYTYVLNNPVSLVDPTGHSYRCGGAYQPVFNTRMWRMVAFGSYLWRTWPMPHQLGPGERSDNGLAFVLNLQFMVASNELIADIELQVKNRKEERERRYLEDLMRRMQAALTNKIPPNVNVEGFFNQLDVGKYESYDPLNDILGDEEFQLFMDALKSIMPFALQLKGKLTLEAVEKMIPNSEGARLPFWVATKQEDVSLADLFEGLLKNGPVILTTYYTNDKESFGFSRTGEDYTQIAFRFDYVSWSSIRPIENPWGLLEKGIWWHCFIHETLHRNSDAYHDDYYSPERDIDPFLGKWPEGWHNY